MFYNNAICDIYIGKSAGKKLLEDISNARMNVKIVSPYLSPFLIKELIRLHSRGINISLVTTDDIEDFYGSYEKNIHKLIIQDIQTDETAKLLRVKWINRVQILFYTCIATSIILLALVYFFMNLKLLFGGVIILLLIIIRNFYQEKIKKQQIYKYSYSQLFPFKVFVSPKNVKSYNSTFIHSKMYIIDDTIAYMGSLNFTASGTKENHETRIRTTDHNAVGKIIEEFDDLFFNSNLPERSIQLWGSQLYDQPIN